MTEPRSGLFGAILAWRNRQPRVEASAEVPEQEDPSVARPPSSEWERASHYMIERDQDGQTPLYTAKQPHMFLQDGMEEELTSKESFGSLDRDVWRAELASEDAGTPPPPSTTTGLPMEPQPGDSPYMFSRKLYQFTKMNLAYQGQTSRLLSVSTSAYLREALASYMQRFHFEEFPIDMALRHFLAMEHLPLESQQIDRVLMAFSERYAACNPSIMDQETAYFLTFSLLLLHTDVFHRSVRPRISKAEYVTLASASHVERVILEYLYDNVSLVEFMFTRNQPVGGDGTSRSPAATREREALYKLISTGRILDLQQQQAAVHERVRFPFSYTSNEFTLPLMHQTGRDAPLMEVTLTIPLARRWRGGHPAAALRRPLLLRILHMGLVRRRESDEDGESRARWKTWGLVLTGSCLLWFKDPATMPRIPPSLSEDDRQTYSFKVDEVMPLAYALCVYDSVTDPMVLRLRTQAHWHEIETQLTHPYVWLDRINYIGSLGSCGLVWDDAVMLPANSTWTVQAYGESLTGPLQTGALGPTESTRDTYKYCVYSAGLSLAQSLMAANRFLTEQRVRHEALVAEHERSVRYAKHLGLLTPLQKSTRDHIQQATMALSHSLRSTQFELAYLSCRMHFLQSQKQVLEAQLQQQGCEIYTPV
ncbi:guanyl-nucleotide exchange factor [Malassezia pachydermatis]|uniref:Arf guanyl-nucleotide exchange factor n=1 Tax=Malassezia pachydermatis TaxID=77020 RepID=A0A0M9VP33_9BASI|nr:arf guanyl-nucleotide exchange factor [Malassezia pachydermatis]KOS13952.1 arf guanyl-nucleotide exchange factor [Malassezia pachydermatis]